MILYGERLLSGPRADHVARALLNVAGRLKLTGAREGAGLLCVPAGTNGRGLAEVGVLPDAGPGLSDAPLEGRSTAQIAGGAAAGELTALYLLHTDPLRDLPHGALWARRLDTATTVVAHADFLTEGIREYATVVFPSESYAEKEGTVTHPDGRLQRLRRSIAHQGETQRRVGDARRARAAHRPRARACRPARGHRPRGRGRPVLRRDHATTRSAAGACAGRSATPRPAFAFEVDLGPFELEPPPPSPAGVRRPLPPRHVPLGVGGARGGGLARAALPASAPARGARARRRPAPRRARGRPRRSSGRTARACTRRSRCAPRCRPGASSSRTRSPRTPPRRSRAPSWRCARRDRPRAPGRRRVRRAVVDADPEVDRDLPRSACRSCRS